MLEKTSLIGTGVIGEFILNQAENDCVLYDTKKQLKASLQFQVKVNVQDTCEDNVKKYYIWIFNDPYSGPDNPNQVIVESLDQPVFHTFAYYGRYNIQLIEVREDGKMIERTFLLDLNEDFIEELSPKIKKFEIVKIEDDKIRIDLDYTSPKEITDIHVIIRNQVGIKVVDAHNQFEFVLDDGLYDVDVIVTNKCNLSDFASSQVKIDVFKILGCKWLIEEGEQIYAGETYTLEVLTKGFADDIVVLFEDSNVQVEKVDYTHFNVTFPEIEEDEKEFSFSISGKGKFYDCQVLVKKKKEAILIGQETMYPPEKIFGEL